MRPRTKSIVNSAEYFREQSAYAQSMHSDDDWMAIAIRGANKSSSPSYGSPLVTKGRKRIGSNESSSSCSTLPSWDENDPDFDMLLEEDDDDDDEDEHDGVRRRRRCSHERRISFDDDVAVVTIPSRESFDAGYKRRVWYSMEDLTRMRQFD